MLRLFFNRGFKTYIPLRNSASSGSIFGSLTKEVDPTATSKLTERLTLQNAGSGKNNDDKEDIAEKVKQELKLGEDKKFQDFVVAQQLANSTKGRPLLPSKPSAATLLSPLKQKLYELNCEINDGFYKKNTEISYNNNIYKLRLTRQELNALEPSVYVKSLRIKSSMRKATEFLRLFVDKKTPEEKINVKTAITQCHFSDKKLARDVASILTKGLKDGEKLGINPDDLYIDQIWCGSDGKWSKRVEFKGRGRVGVIQHRYIHIRAILKSKSVTLKRLIAENKEKLDSKKPWIQLGDKKIRGVPGSAFKW
ncbi:related to 54S ribosomal protein L22, mitochondrial [Saccharomycodes ludwigii]|uniref:Related to 54S ribosomal protein L22, mitochondrial n=1 Tax=Saccharomycodes ludwigii TaxID=36035 RepID=A0A376B384_9ASCO|nr:related to 54S ribosomal protein L22, mitochondrial [Saccharomycodes ludwigii]